MVQSAEYRRGDADVAQQQTMYRSFNTLVHWGSLAIAVILVFLVLWLCAHAGFLPAAIAAVVIAVAGTVWLRRPSDH